MDQRCRARAGVALRHAVSTESTTATCRHYHPLQPRRIIFVLTPIVIARDSILRRKWIGLIAASAFLLIHLLSPSMTGIIAIWSIGLTLYLPSIFYALAIGCVCALAMDARTRGDAASRALPVLLILAGGYAPQLSAQLFLNLIGVWLLASDHAISHRFA